LVDKSITKIIIKKFSTTCFFVFFLYYARLRRVAHSQLRFIGDIYTELYYPPLYYYSRSCCAREVVGPVYYYYRQLSDGIIQITYILFLFINSSDFMGRIRFKFSSRTRFSKAPITAGKYIIMQQVAATIYYQGAVQTRFGDVWFYCKRNRLLNNKI